MENVTTTEDTTTTQQATEVTTPDPGIQAAITAAVEAATRHLRHERDAIKNNRDALLSEKAAQRDRLAWIEDFGGIEKAREALEAAATKEHRDAAIASGADSEQFRKAVDAAAQEKHKLWLREQERLLKAKDDQLADLNAKVEQASARAHRSFVAEHLLRAAIPHDMRLFHEGAWDILVDRLAPVTEEKTIDGFPEPVPRIKIGDTYMPSGRTGATPDGLMGYDELFPLIQNGKAPGPLANLGFLCVSNARGTGTTAPSGKSGTHKNWFKMSPSEQTAFIDEHSPEEVQDMIDTATRGEKSVA